MARVTEARKEEGLTRRAGGGARSGYCCRVNRRPNQF